MDTFFGSELARFDDAGGRRHAGAADPEERDPPFGHSGQVQSRREYSALNESEDDDVSATSPLESTGV